jgi:CDP-diacylglycerol pyrophosphatase
MTIAKSPGAGPRGIAFALAMAAAGFAGSGPSAGAAGDKASGLPRDALWTVVRSCIVAQQTIGVPFPCVEVDPPEAAGAVAVLRPPIEDTHLLVVPQQRMAGIEAAEPGSAGMAQVWRRAWESRRLLSTRPVAWDRAGMALNGPGQRSQDQLHIHVDCLDESKIRILDPQLRRLGPGWTRLSGAFGRIWALRVDAADLSRFDPVSLADRGLPFRRETASLGVMGTKAPNGRPAFVVFASPTDSLELILDSSCGVLKSQSASGA